MTIQEFAQKYNGRENLCEIEWNDFPAELQIICWNFMRRWFEETDTDDLREITGFNDMSVEDLLKRATD